MEAYTVFINLIYCTSDEFSKTFTKTGCLCENFAKETDNNVIQYISIVRKLVQPMTYHNQLRVTSKIPLTYQLLVRTYILIFNIVFNYRGILNFNHSFFLVPQ